MNLQENIQRIKEVMGLISEEEIRIHFNMQDLLDKGIIFITQAHDLTTGEKIPSEIDPETGEEFKDSTNLITLWNILYPVKGVQDGIAEALKHPRPDQVSWWQDNQKLLSKEKYEQILRSIKLKDDKEVMGLNEAFKPVEYLKYMLDTKKPPGSDSFERYQWIKAFQKYVDLLYRYTTEVIPIDGVDRMIVGTVWSQGWGEDFNKKNKKNTKIIWTVRLYPRLIDNPKTTKDKFLKQYEKFQDIFNELAMMLEFDINSPIKSDGVKENIVKYNFLNIDTHTLKDKEEEPITRQEQTESEITERCWKGYTQKGMKTMFGKRYPNCVKKTKK